MSTGRGRLHGLALPALIALTLLADAARADDARRFGIDVEVLPVPHFRIGSDETRFGMLEYVGGFEMRSDDPRFGQISSIRFLSPGRRFIGVADHGYWLFGTIMRDADGRPVAIGDASMQAMVDVDGPLHRDKHFSDAEGLSIRDGVATVSFERDHRLLEFAIEPEDMGQPIGEVPFLIPIDELGYNEGIETVARAPEGGHLDGARIVVSERSLDPEGNLFAAIIEGPERGGFFVARSDDFDVTDGAFLPHGDLILLERRFSPFFGGTIRLRRIAGADIRAGVLVDGQVLMEADMTHQIDNFEAVDAWRSADGSIVLSLLSDDNLSSLQRTLYLEFRLLEE